MNPRKQILASDLFDSAWYLERYADVGMLGMNPVEHYLRLGALMGRSPGPNFDGPRYLNENGDVAASGANPLLHYLRRGRKEGRIAYVLERSSIQDPRAHLNALANARIDGQPRRMFNDFDSAAEIDFFDCLDRVSPSKEAPIVSVIMPAYNRGGTIRRAIDSVRAQTYSNWELLIVDDGSNDDTLEVVESFSFDSRIRLFRQDHKGVSAARNTGLVNASGDWIFYLDSDNRWTPRFIGSMLAYLQVSGRSCGYSGIAVEDDAGNISGYRGEPFDWDACLRGNYVDLNAFCHAKALYQRMGGFDENLRRMVDWDLILRYTRKAHPVYAPFTGCYYLDSKSDGLRISVAQPIAYRAVVQTKNQLDAAAPDEVARALSLTIAIKIPAPFDKRQEWGDFHYAESLATSLERLGHKVRIDFLGDWYKRPVSQEPVVIVVRGLTAYEPRPGQINILWNISHPDQIGYEEYRSYDLIYVASLSYPSLLREIVDKPVRTLLQCADTGRFRPQTDQNAGDDVLFVGNSRNEYRKIVRWAVEAGSDLKVYGTRWEQFIGEDYIAGANIDNRELARHYGAARVVLNDHWDSMRDFGFLSNRIFDVLASGGTLISDSVPSIDVLFPRGVLQVDSRSELEAALSLLARRDEDSTKDIAFQVAELHSFDVRAQQLSNDVLDYLGLPRIHAQGDRAGEEIDAMLASRRVRIGLIMQLGRFGPTSSGFIRLLAPLTTDLAATRFEVVTLEGMNDPRLDECDACVVQRVAIGELEDARELVRKLKASGKKLFVDNDDAFSNLSHDHPELEMYSVKDVALRYLMSEADRVWFSTKKLAELYRDAAPRANVIENMLDPRLWRNYRKVRRELQPSSCLQMLYMGTATHDSDFALVLPALDRLHQLHPGSFALTVVGALRTPPERPWLSVLTPPRGGYPEFVRWLVQQGPFDVGLAPLVSSEFNDCKSDIKFLDYSALGIVSCLSDVPAYRGIIGEQQLALLARNDVDGWFEQLNALVTGQVDMENIAARAAAYVWGVRSASHSGLLSSLMAELPH